MGLCLQRCEAVDQWHGLHNSNSVVLSVRHSLCSVYQYTGDIGIQTYVQFWTRLYILTCPMQLIHQTQSKPLFVQHFSGLGAMVGLQHGRFVGMKTKFFFFFFLGKERAFCLVVCLNIKNEFDNFWSGIAYYLYSIFKIIYIYIQEKVSLHISFFFQRVGIYDRFLLSNQDTNRFLVQAEIESRISYSIIKDFTS